MKTKLNIDIASESMEMLPGGSHTAEPVLRTGHYATSRKVAGSIPDDITGFFFQLT
jgi:hypothetical protein